MSIFPNQRQQAPRGTLESVFTNPLFVMGASVMGGENVGQGLAKGAQIASNMQDASMRRDLMQKKIDAAPMGVPPTATMREYEVAKKQGFEGNILDFKKAVGGYGDQAIRDAKQHARAKELLRMRLEAATAKGGQTKYGLNPIYGRDANGNVVLLQPGTDGTAAQTAIPEGVTVDPSLAPEARARGSAVGKSTGVAQSDLANVEHDTSTLLGQIDALRNDPYLSSMTGGSAYFPNVTPRSHEVQARIDQLGGKAFLQAFQKLKGAGQITEMEGMRAEKALTRLSNVHQGDEAYKEALDEFRAEVVKLLENAKRKAGIPTDSARTFKVLR